MSQLPGRLRVTKESTAMYHLRVPQTEEELESYYQFRWEMLRKPMRGMRWRTIKWWSMKRVIWLPSGGCM